MVFASACCCDETRAYRAARSCDVVSVIQELTAGNGADVVFAERLFADAARFVEGEIKEMDVVVLHAGVASTGAGFGAGAGAGVSATASFIFGPFLSTTRL